MKACLDLEAQVGATVEHEQAAGDALIVPPPVSMVDVADGRVGSWDWARSTDCSTKDFERTAAAGCKEVRLAARDRDAADYILCFLAAGDELEPVEQAVVTGHFPRLNEARRRANA